MEPVHEESRLIDTPDGNRDIHSRELGTAFGLEFRCVLTIF